MIKDNPQYINLSATKPDGYAYASAVPLSGSVYFGDRPWFKRAVESHQFATSDFLVGRVVGRGVFGFGYPVYGEDGTLIAVLAASVDLSWLNKFVQAAGGLPAGAAHTILDGNGAILARYPDPETWTGRSTSGTPIVEAVLADHRAGRAELAGVDGVTRLYAFAPVDGTNGGMSVVVGIPRATALAAADRALTRSLILFGAGGAILVALFWVLAGLFVANPVNELVAATSRLAAGDLTARSRLPHGQGELSRLGLAFDEMAQALEQRQGELRQAEAKYRTLVEQSPAVTYVASADDRENPTYVSPQFEAMLGYPVREVMHRGFVSKRIHPDDARRVADALQASTACAAPMCIEYRLLTRDGHVLWVRDASQLVCDDAGQALFWQGILIDITDSKHREEQMQRDAVRAELLAGVSQASAECGFDCGATMDRAARCISEALNAGCMVSLLSKDRQALEPMTVHHPRPESLALLLDLADAGPYSLEHALSERAVRTDRPHLMPTVDRSQLRCFMRPEYRAYPDRLNVFTLALVPMHAQGQVIGVLSVARDEPSRPFTPQDEDFLQETADRIALAYTNAQLFTAVQRALTERERAEQEVRLLNEELEARVLRRTSELEAANKELEAFTYSVSHDLRAPIRTIAGFSEMLLEDYRDSLDAEARRRLQIVIDHAYHMGNLVESLLRLSRLGRVRLGLVPVDMTALTREAFEEVRQSNADADVTLELDALEPTSGDRGLLRQVWVNLLSNAVKFSRPKGQVMVKVSSWTTDAENVYSVRDNGVGFRHAVRRQAVRRFSADAPHRPVRGHRRGPGPGPAHRPTPRRPSVGRVRGRRRLDVFLRLAQAVGCKLRRSSRAVRNRGVSA